MVITAMTAAPLTTTARFIRDRPRLARRRPASTSTTTAHTPMAACHAGKSRSEQGVVRHDAIELRCPGFRTAPSCCSFAFSQVTEVNKGRFDDQPGNRVAFCLPQGAPNNR